MGNIEEIETYMTPVGNSTLFIDSQTFSYDERNRLVEAQGTARIAININAYHELYNYDLLGNLTQLGHQGQTTLQYNNPAHKHAATHRNNTLAFTYDNNGNMLSRNEGSISYTQQYDPENRLIRVTESGNNNWFTQFNYDAGEQRTLTIDETAYSQRTTTYYPFPLYEEAVIEVWREPNQCPILEAPEPPPPGCWETWQTIQRAVYTLAGQAIATRVTTDPPQFTDGLFYFITDHLGSTRLLATSNGSPVQGTTAHYLPYGDYRGAAPTATTLTERGYTGHHENREIGLTYMNARFYSPTTGRFLTADVVMPGLTNPQAHNRYTYSFGNPLSWVDPTGHSPCSPDDNECNMGLVAADIHTLSGGMLLIHDLATWTLAELRLILEAVQQIMNGLQREAGTAEGARALLSSLIGGTAISLVRSGATGLMGWNPDQRRIYVYDKGLQQSQAKITWDLAHEIGHVIETTWASAAEFVQFTGGTYNDDEIGMLMIQFGFTKEQAQKVAYKPGALSPRALKGPYESWSYNARRHPSEDLAETIAFGILFGRGGGGAHATGANYFSYPGTVRMDYYQLIIDRARGIGP